MPLEDPRVRVPGVHEPFSYRAGSGELERSGLVPRGGGQGADGA